jgi:hypothetical protein
LVATATGRPNHEVAARASSSYGRRLAGGQRIAS